MAASDINATERTANRFRFMEVSANAASLLQRPHNAGGPSRLTRGCYQKGQSQGSGGFGDEMIIILRAGIDECEHDAFCMLAN